MRWAGTYVNVTAEGMCLNLGCVELLKIITCLLTNYCEFSRINNDNHNDANRMRTKTSRLVMVIEYDQTNGFSYGTSECSERYHWYQLQLL